MFRNQSHRPIPLILVSLPNSGIELLRAGVRNTGHFVEANEALERNDPDASNLPARIEDFCNGMIVAGDRQLKQFAMIDVSYASLISRLENAPALQTNVIERTRFAAWLVEKRVPVVHVFRENVLDCAVHEFSMSLPERSNRKLKSSCDAGPIIKRINQMRNDIGFVRSELKDANCLELKYEKLRQHNGRIALLPLHQLHKFLGIEIDASRLNTTAKVDQREDEQLAQLKLLLRPELTRSGLGNLYNLPKAA